MRDAMWCAECQDSSHDYPDCPPASETLPAWLLQQIAEEDERTQALLSAAQATNVMLRDQAVQFLGRRIPGWHDWPDVERMCQQRLAELDALRQVVGLHADQHACEDPRSWEYPYVGCQTVRVHAMPFADQPGYQEVWKP